MYVYELTKRNIKTLQGVLTKHKENSYYLLRLYYYILMYTTITTLV